MIKNQRRSEKKTVRPFNSLYLRNLCSFALDNKDHDFPVVACIFMYVDHSLGTDSKC